jgi:hypothetical protein|tara:strand:+ start:430 stop:1338 length:909 start_codon:yes stop_codon:yes gene_type:complete
MAFTTVSNFAGKSAGFYISASLKASNSLDYLTLIENIKFKSNIQQMAGSNVVTNAGCDFLSAGTLALTEKVLEPKNLQINLDLCKSTLLDSWEALQMRAGAGAPPPASFNDYVISYMGEIIAESTENSIWSGTNVAGEFNGFLGLVTGLLLPGPDPTVVQDGAVAAPYTAGNIISNLQGAVAAIPTSTLGKEDLHIYMSQRTYQYYIGAVSTLGYVNAYNMNGDYVPMFEGYKLAVCNGMEENQLVVAQKSNLYFGTDLISDSTRISLMDMAALDGSDNMRLVCRYSAGVQTGVGADIVRQS